MSLPEVSIAASAWIAAAANLIVNFMLLRTSRSVSIVRSLLWSFLVGLVLLFISIGLAWRHLPYEGIAPRFTAAALTYVCVSYFFFHLVHIPEASVRLRVLQELAAGVPLTQSDILRRYNAGSILDIRLQRLTGSGQIVVDAGRFFTGRKRMLYIAAVFSATKRILLGK